MTEKMSREELIRKVNELIDSFLFDHPSEKEEKEVCPKCNGTGWITEIHRGRIYDTETYGESGRPCPDCAPSPADDWEPKVGEWVWCNYRQWNDPPPAQPVKIFELNMNNVTGCHRIQRVDGTINMSDIGELEPLKDHSIPPADGGKEEEEVDWDRTIDDNEYVQVTILNLQNEINRCKHRCEQYEKRDKILVKTLKNVLDRLPINAVVEVATVKLIRTVYDKIKEEYPLDME